MLTVITGPMFCGKTSRLISLIETNIIAGFKAIVFFPSNDIRYGSINTIRTHSGRALSAKKVNKKSPTCMLSLCQERKVDVIGIDEAQFFNASELNATVTNLLFLQKKHIIVAGLANDFEGRPFGAMPDLLGLADEIISLKAVCAKCKTIGTATRTFRKTEDKTQTVIGGSEIYEPRCFICWMEKPNEI